MDNETNIQAHFIKQRRNLISVALFIIFYKTANFQIHQINVLGNYIEIGNSYIIIKSLKIAFMYFLWRYYTACREICGISKFINTCASWAETRIKNKILKEEKNKLDNNCAVRVHLTERHLGRRGYIIEKNDSGLYIKDKDIIVTWRFVWNMFLSLFHTIFHTSTFSEYILPYILAFLAILSVCNFI